MTLFLDFDGTIVDVSDRYYRLHLSCLADSSHPISAEQYWALKRDRMPEEDILQTYYPAEAFEGYEKKRMEHIEDPVFLVYDRLIDGARETLQTLKESATLILVTLRKKPETLQAQIDALQLRSLFDDILVSPPIDGPSDTKVQMIRPRMQEGDWIIGDTDADILAGQTLGIHTCATLTGIRSREQLDALHPEHVIADITHLPALLSDVH